MKGLSGIFNGPDILVVAGPYEHFKSVMAGVASTDHTPVPSTHSNRSKRRGGGANQHGPAHAAILQKRDRLSKTREYNTFCCVDDMIPD